MADTELVPLAPDLSDVQGEIFQPYNHAVGYHMFLTFQDGAGARAFVRGQLPKITTAASQEKGESISMNIGFTYAGIAALGLAEEELVTFPYPFRVGMAFRAPQLGDTGASAPDQWTKPYGQREIHGWLMVQAETEDSLHGRVDTISRRAAEHGVKICHHEETANFTGEHARAKEHFGFMDGIGEPDVNGGPGPAYPGQGTPAPDGKWEKLATGSFLLGYQNEYGETSQYPDNPKLRWNGTYMAFRKLEQHVTLFRDYIEANKHLLGGDGELLAAKMVGRWRSGAPLELSPDKDDWALAMDSERNNDFRYADDLDGMRVPHLAHIRRVNPRDSLPPESVVEPRRHRIIRRSMPYGPWLPEGEPEGTTKRGLIFRVLNADLLDQFEMVQSQWVASADEAGGLSTDQDVIAGLTDPVGKDEQILQSTLRIPRPDGIKTLYGLPRFVTLMGGDYFFLPGIRAIELLASEPANDKDSS